jgi:hypothetical protein
MCQIPKKKKKICRYGAVKKYLCFGRHCSVIILPIKSIIYLLETFDIRGLNIQVNRDFIASLCGYNVYICE